MDKHTCELCGYTAEGIKFQAGCPACCDGDPNGIPTVFHMPDAEQGRPVRPHRSGGNNGGIPWPHGGTGKAQQGEGDKK